MNKNKENYLIAIRTILDLIKSDILSRSDFDKFEEKLAEKYDLKYNSIYRKTLLDIVSY